MRTRWPLVYGMLVGLAGLIVAFAPLPRPAPALPTARTVRIEASQFFYSPSVISVDQGDTLTIELVSKDVVHGLYVDDYAVSVEADPGQTRALTFVANRPGSFRIRCNVTCGAMHPFMIGKLEVGQDTTLMRSIGLALVGMAGLAVFPRRGSQKADSS